jgi:polysaccharide pyruvyl transferase WcaK-like protein
MRPDPTRARIALFGNFGTGNLGNEATLQAMLYNLRRHLPISDISCVCPQPEYVASDYKILAIPMKASVRKLIGLSRNGNGPAQGSNESAAGGVTKLHQMPSKLWASLRFCASPLIEAYRWLDGIVKLSGNDCLIMTGTGMLGNYGIEPLGLHYDIFRWSVIAKLCRCKLVFASVGGGPTPHPLSRYFLRSALALADYRSYRDASTRDRLEAIGVDVKNDAVCPDLAFSLPRAVIPTSHDPDGQGIVIGVGMMNYYDRFGHCGDDETIYRDYVGRMAAFVARLVERRHTVRILIGDLTWDQDVRRDLRTALKERGLNYDDGRIIDEPARSVDELLSQLSSVDIVAASRFHNIVLALMLRKPVLAISYHEKFRPLMNGVGLGGYCQDIEHIDVDELIGMITNLQKDAVGLKLQIARQIESYRVALDEEYERILNYLRAGPQHSDISQKWGPADRIL